MVNIVITVLPGTIVLQQEQRESLTTALRPQVQRKQLHSKQSALSLVNAHALYNHVPMLNGLKQNTESITQNSSN